MTGWLSCVDLLSVALPFSDAFVIDGQCKIIVYRKHGQYNTACRKLRYSSYVHALTGRSPAQCLCSSGFDERFYHAFKRFCFTIPRSIVFNFLSPTSMLRKAVAQSSVHLMETSRKYYDTAHPAVDFRPRDGRTWMRRGCAGDTLTCRR